MATDGALVRSRERIERLASSSTDLEGIQRECVAVLRAAVGFERWCWPVADPHTLIPGPGLAEHDYGPRLPRALAHEYSGADWATKAKVGRGPHPVASLSGETGGDLFRSPRWDEVLRPVNIGDVAVLACRDAHGCWGWLELYRNADDRPFSGRELRLLADLSPTLGALSRRGARADAAGPSGVDPPPSGAAVLILDAELGLVGQTAAARRWVAALPAAQLFAGWGILPAVVYPTAVRALHGRPDLATALNRTVDGTWLSVSAARLEDASGVAVTLRPATSAEVTALLGRAYGLTGRERQVARLVADGHRTEDIARRMAISGWTVQDHLKAAFDKLGVHRREELVGLLAGGPRLQPEDPGQVARH